MTKYARPYLVLIKQALHHISDYQPANLEELKHDVMRQDAIMMRLQEVGENFVRLRDKTPEYYHAHARDDWTKVIGLRNLISHGYEVIEMERIWEILIHHLPALSEYVDELLAATSGVNPEEAGISNT